MGDLQFEIWYTAFLKILFKEAESVSTTALMPKGVIQTLT